MIRIYHQHNDRTFAEEPQVDFTPMLDVIFILLIFMVLLIGDAHLHALQVELPHVRTEKLPVAAQQEHALLQVHMDGSYSFNEQKITTLAELQAMLRKERPTAVVLACDKQVAIKNLLEVFSTLREAGIVATDVLLTAA